MKIITEYYSLFKDLRKIVLFKNGKVKILVYEKRLGEVTVYETAVFFEDITNNCLNIEDKRCYEWKLK